MIATDNLRQLAQIQTLLAALVEAQNDKDTRTQYHPDLSPLGWHLGHCVYIENYWLHEVLAGDATRTRPLERLYVAGNTPKPERGALLAPHAELIAWAQREQSDNLMLLSNLRAPLADHELLRDDYLVRFLIQHHCQHYETMLMILTQRALAADYPDHHVTEPLQASSVQYERREIPSGQYRIGGAAPDAYDNELPPQIAELGRFALAARPVSNGDWLAFMHADGYARDEHWSEQGRAWRAAHDIQHPDHWRRDAHGEWYGIGLKGPYALAADAPVLGVSHYEASAFAVWAGARLPHEYQWEVARRLGLLEQEGQAWEWCANTFHPYAGFKAFPYEGYSTPWFDGTHYTLRGAGIHTRPQIRRPSFRNFYQADKRHIFAGLRLVF